jgi:hypothetical protein
MASSHKPEKETLGIWTDIALPGRISTALVTSSTRSRVAVAGDAPVIVAYLSWHRPLNLELESLCERACVADGHGQNVTMSGRMNV